MNSFLPAGLLIGLVCQCGQSQTSSPHDFVKDIAADQQNIFFSPAHVKKRDLKWLIPLGATVGYLMATDQRNMTDHIHTNAQWQKRSSEFSDIGVLSLAAVPVFLTWKGWHDGDHFDRDSGILAARAVADALIDAELLKMVAGRERPLLDGAAGSFETGSRMNSSFPSIHSAAAWAIASVVAERYPGWFTQLASYGLASAVSFSRIPARQHFPSDVLVGSAMGFLIGRYVAHQGKPRSETRFSYVKPKVEHGGNNASFVPVDSWVYPALDRLAALGFVPSQISGLRPWSRAECLRQVEEADTLAREREANSDVLETLAALHRELDTNEESGTIVVDSVYTRSGYISGPVLHNSLDFGQTWRNDLGRPFGSGFNMINGFRLHAEEGHFFAVFQGEQQNSPGDPPYSLATRQLISGLDLIPLQPAQAQQDTNHFQVIEGYVGARFGNVEFSVGQQEMWWGPTYDAPLSFSANALPLKSGKLTTAQPFHLPGVLQHLGEIRAELVLGKLGGQQYTWRPWFNAQKISFKLTDNLEVGFTRWAIFWGVGHPITFGSFANNFVSLSSLNGQLGAKDPGDRKAGFDFRYRIPGLRNWLTLYSDSYSDDDPSPLAAPRRAALSPGIYLTHVPGLDRLSLRMEAASTELMKDDEGGWLNYINYEYRSGNTNYGYLVGNPVTRDARAIEGWATYRFSPRRTLEAGYRQMKGGGNFLPGGSTQTDATLKAEFEFKKQWHGSAFFQVERYDIPVIGAPGRNVSGWLQIAWEPKLVLAH